MARPENIRELTEVVEPESKLPRQQNDYGVSINRNFGAALTSEVSLIEISDRIFPYWSRRRDRFLWECMVKSDLLSSALNITTARLFSIPFSIEPKDKDNRRDREIAYWSHLLLRESWATEMYKFIVDWQGQDNGAFMEILGAGDPQGPIEPTLVPGTSTYLYGLGFRHIDSTRCIRTGNPEYPVVYESIDERGRYKRYKLHASRVLESSQMPSPRENLFGVGFCFTSRAIRHVMHLDDIDILKEEWLGSRPVSEIIFGRGISAVELEASFRKADQKAIDQGLKRFAKAVYLGIEGLPEMIKASGIERISLKRLPEGYDEEKALRVGVNVIAMAAGFDARTFMPATSAGATTADAQYSHLKAQKMTPGVWSSVMEAKLRRNFAPNSTNVTAEQQDDEQDRIRAENRKIRSAIRAEMLNSKQIDNLTCFQMMLEEGDINEAQYEALIEWHKEEEAKRQEMEDIALEERRIAMQDRQNAASGGKVGASSGVPGDGDGDGKTNESPDRRRPAGGALMSVSPDERKGIPESKVIQSQLLRELFDSGNLSLATSDAGGLQFTEAIKNGYHQ